MFEEGGIRCTGCARIINAEKLTGFDNCYHHFCGKCMPRKAKANATPFTAVEGAFTCVGCNVRKVGDDGKPAYTCIAPDCASEVSHVLFAPEKGDVLPESFGLDL